MGLTLYNTLTRKMEEFKPIEKGRVKLYSCGPTVYEYPHIGNFRSFVFIDLFKRYLLFLGFDVQHVTNLTDVDDKIIARCNTEGVSLKKLTDIYKSTFFEDMEILSIMQADVYPAATDHISDMQELVRILIEKGHAYVTSDGSVFFDISSFKDYGILSKVDLTGSIRTERVLSDEYDKENVHDFALWKGWKEEDGDIWWDSPWGKGRPGWHIECSTMSMKYLGEHFDIHCGGVDLIFPHHENEIAQSVCATGKPFVNMWVHCEHLLVDGTKMSKSLGNYYILQDLLEKGYDPTSIRYLLLTTHYRQKLNLTEEGLRASAGAVERLQDIRLRLEALAGDLVKKHSKTYKEVEDQFINSLNRDLNISEGLAVIFDWIRELNRQIENDNIDRHKAAEAISLLKRFDTVLAVIFKGEIILSDNDRQLIREREEARLKKDWKRADEIRDYFQKISIKLEDTPNGTVVKKV